MDVGDTDRLGEGEIEEEVKGTGVPGRSANGGVGA